MLDVHILVSEDTRKAWVRNSILSVREAIKKAEYEVNLFVLPGVLGHIGKGRANGYAQGTAKWKTYVDDDDYVLPTAFVDLQKYLDQDVAAIFTSEYVEQNGKRHPKPQKEHHLQVYRDDLVHGYDHHLAAMSDVWCLELAKKDPRGFLSVDDVTYVHRVYYDSKARVMRRNNPQEREALRQAFPRKIQ